MTSKQLLKNVRDRYARDCGSPYMMPLTYAKFIRHRGKFIGADVLDYNTDEVLATYVIAGKARRLYDVV